MDIGVAMLCDPELSMPDIMATSGPKEGSLQRTGLFTRREGHACFF